MGWDQCSVGKGTSWPSGRHIVGQSLETMERAYLNERYAGCGCHGHGASTWPCERMKRCGLLTEPSQPQARPSLRRCDPGIRHSLTEEHGPVEDSLTVAPRSSLHKSAGFLALVAERPPKVAVGLNPRSAITPSHLVAERRWNPLRAIGDPFHSRRCPPLSIVAPRRIIPVSSPSVV